MIFYRKSFYMYFFIQCKIKKLFNQLFQVSWTVYTTFGHLMGYISILVLTVLFLTVFVSELVAGFWLTYWVDSPLLNNASIPADSVERANENYFYLKVYSVWGILESNLQFIRMIMLSLSTK